MATTDGSTPGKPTAVPEWTVVLRTATVQVAGVASFAKLGESGVEFYNQAGDELAVFHVTEGYFPTPLNL